MQIKNKLNNSIVCTFLLLFVNKIMFTKYFFSAPKVLLFFGKRSAFFARNALLFPWKGAFLKCFFLPKSTTIPVSQVSGSIDVIVAM